MAQTEDFIFQNVAYRATVNRTGGVVFPIPSLKLNGSSQVYQLLHTHFFLNIFFHTNFCFKYGQENHDYLGVFVISQGQSRNIVIHMYISSKKPREGTFHKKD